MGGTLFLWVYITHVPYQVTCIPLSWIREVHNVCALSLFPHKSMRSVVYGRLGSLLLPTLLVVCLFSIFSHNVLIGPPCIPLVVTDISLICGRTTGPNWDSLCPVASSGVYLLFKNNEYPL